MTADKSKPTVLQVLPAMMTGGVERGTVEIAESLMANGYGAVVASAGGRLVHALQRCGATHVTLPVDSKSPFVMYANIQRLMDVAEDYDVDIIHARSRAPAWSAWYAAARSGRSFVTTFHGTYNFSNPVKRRYNAIMTRGRPVIAISQFIADHVATVYGLDPRHLRLVPRGVDVAAFDPDAVSPERIIRLSNKWRLPDGAPVVMLPGRLTRWKGQLVLVEALARLNRRDLRCILVGSDQGRSAYRQEILERAEAAGLGAVVHVVDHCDDMPAAYMLADVVVSASTDPEAFGRVAVEAQAMGRPVVATDHGGARETVLPGRTGWLVAPNAPDALARGIETALGLLEKQRETLARTAIAHVRATFTRAEMCRRTLAVYDEVAAEAERQKAAKGGPRPVAAAAS